MNAGEFVAALMRGGSTNISDFEDDPEYCPVHAWDHSTIGNLYHQDECEPYAAKLAARMSSGEHAS